MVIRTVEEIGKGSGSFQSKNVTVHFFHRFFSVCFRFVNSPIIALKINFEKRGPERKVEMDERSDVRDKT